MGEVVSSGPAGGTEAGEVGSGYRAVEGAGSAVVVRGPL